MTNPNKFYKRLVVAESGCLEWSGCCKSKGYGWLTFNGKSWGAHRLAWVLEHGDIPVGMCVCHKCDNPKCCNVNHLFLGTVADNTHDMIAKGRQKFASMVGKLGEGSPNHRHSFETITAIRGLRGAGLLQREVAQMFGATQSFVSAVWRESKRRTS
jgi:hypothetical protein